MQQFDAIYENGVLRPLTPLPFEEHQQVRVFVTAAFSQKPEAWSNVKDRVEETGKKLGVIPDKPRTESKETTASA